MAGLPLCAAAPASSHAPLGATHRNTLSGLQFRKSSEDDPRQHALILAPDGWRATGWRNRDLDAHPFARLDDAAAAAPALSQREPGATTRTRRTFASIPVACGELLTVQVSRRARECTGVQLLHGIDGEADRIAHLLLQPATARMLARALIEAASAVDQAQRSPVFTRREGGAA